mgnify:CR=1 FL=1|tara:strand:+ start:210 stop:1652 length:1443 start_codon:yes stop_codon:yes gene_type:complete
MLFNSIEFAFFLPIVFILYWFVFNKKIRSQNILLLIASYVFYGWWDWRFLFLIVFSSFVDFVLGLRLSKTNNNIHRKVFIFTSIAVNIGFLGFFKYYNFFAENFADAFTFFGQAINPDRLNIILPVGISFYTFQTLSYTIDIYRKKLEPTTNIVSFFAFVSFFPQLVAGPIERATNLLPQFHKKRKIEYASAVDGMRQILLGLFKKIVIADNCAPIVNTIFESPESYSGSTLFIGAALFAFQIYGDFSGYSDIAIGTSRLFGFNLMKNFALPYFSRDIAEFWRRWHISLSTWFRDYVYIPLGGSRGNLTLQVRNIFIIFIVSGFWHGANWTFIIWGVLHALFYLPLMFFKQHKKHTEIVSNKKYVPSFIDLLKITSTFILTTLAWVFFRANSVTDAFEYLNGVFSNSLLNFPEIFPTKLILLISVLILLEWLRKEYEHTFSNLQLQFKKPVRWGFYLSIIFMIYFFGNTDEAIEFIYFQF